MLAFVSKKEAISPKILSRALVKESTSKVTWDSSDDLKYKNIFKEIKLLCLPKPDTGTSHNDVSQDRIEVGTFEFKNPQKFEACVH